MRALIIYESLLGNTFTVAKAVADGLREGCEVQLVEVSDAPDVLGGDLDLLVIGAPTHAHGLSSPKSRADSAKPAAKAGVPVHSTGRGVREWLEAMKLDGQPAVASFDTRLSGPRLVWGSAARAIAKRLESRGLTMAVEPECFLLGGITKASADWLRAGEVDRARAWAVSLGEAVAARS